MTKKQRIAGICADLRSGRFARKQAAPWNRCDQCGKFISLADFESGAAKRQYTPETEFTGDSFENTCARCAKPRPR